MATNTYDCEAYLRALEEQVEAMQKGGEELLGSDGGGEETSGLHDHIIREYEVDGGHDPTGGDFGAWRSSSGKGGDKERTRRQQLTVEATESATTARNDVFASKSITTS